MKKIGMIAALAVILGTGSVALAADDTMTKLCDEMMAKADTDKDGSISETEFLAAKKLSFAKYDTDGNHMLSKSEHHTMMKEMHEMMMGKSPMAHGGTSESGHKM